MRELRDQGMVVRKEASHQLGVPATGTVDRADPRTTARNLTTEHRPRRDGVRRETFDRVMCARITLIADAVRCEPLTRCPVSRYVSAVSTRVFSAHTLYTIVLVHCERARDETDRCQTGPCVCLL